MPTRLTSDGLGGMLVVLCLLVAGLATAPRASATGYGPIGTFSEGLKEPVGVAVDNSRGLSDTSTGDVYVANEFEERGIDKFGAAGNRLSPPSPFDFQPAGEKARLSGAAVDPVNGDLYVVNGREETIQTFNPSGVEVAGAISVSGSAVPSFFLGAGDGVVVQIATDSEGNVYFPDPALGVVQEFNPGGTLINTFGGTSVGAFKKPAAVAVDSEGNVYVADTGNGRVVRIENAAGHTDPAGVQTVLTEGGARTVAIDPSDGDVFVGKYNEEDSCSPLSSPCFHVVEYSAAGIKLDDFGAGVIGESKSVFESFGESFGFSFDNLAVSATTHRVYVTGRNAPNEGDIAIFSQVTPPVVTYPTPTVTGLSASEATLHGEVNPAGNETSCQFEYGTSDDYGMTVPCQPSLVGEGDAAKPESVMIARLEGNTEYHFRLIAKTAGGEVVQGADQTFTTQEAPPELLPGSVLASSVTETTVVFTSTINPQHLDTHYYFNYGVQPFEDGITCRPPVTVPYASAPATPIDLGEGTVPEAVSLDLDSASVVLHPGMEARALAPDTVYHFQAVAQNAAGTSCEPEATFITLPPDPAANTGVATGVTQTAANLAGTVTPGSTGPNSDTTWHFQYGTSTSYAGGSVPATSGDAGMGTSAVTISTALEGLAPNTTYTYRLVASNVNEDPAADPSAAPQIAYGVDRTFTTQPVEPVAGQPSDLAETEVTLDGTVNPSGHALGYRFEYGTSSAYGQSTPLGLVGEADEYTSVSATLRALAPGTYHYRVVAVGTGGETYSPDATFTLYPTLEQTTISPFSVGSRTPPPFTPRPLVNTPSFPEVDNAPASKAKAPSCVTKAGKIKVTKERKAALKRCEARVRGKRGKYGKRSRK